MLEYYNIKSFSQKLGTRDDLAGSFLASIFASDFKTYMMQISRHISLGYLYRHDPLLSNPSSISVPDTTNLYNEIKDVVAQTSIMLTTVFRIKTLSETEKIIEHLIEILFDIGYNYGDENKQNLDNQSDENDVAATDVKLDDDITDFLNGLSF